GAKQQQGTAGQASRGLTPCLGGNDGSKAYSFRNWSENSVNFKKCRFRRRHKDIKRYYKCRWPYCKKEYGTLKHLNEHIMAKGHGLKR
ncbi:hypothetical protein LXA43DRAFT_868227, partial [Ganoderma leucocontextum]